jgi:hypothetical protein
LGLGFCGLRGEDIFGGGAVAVGVADLAIEDDALAIEQEGGGISGFVGGVPAQAIEGDDLEAGVEDEADVGREGSLFVEELGAALGERGGIGRGGLVFCHLGGGDFAGIDEEDLNFAGGEFGGVLDEGMDLLLAVRALVAGVAAQEDERDVALGEEAGEPEGLAIEGGEGEVGCLAGKIGGSGSLGGEGEGHEKGEGGEADRRQEWLLGVPEG